MPQWHEVLATEKQQAYFSDMLRYIAQQRLAGKVIYPDEEDVFNAFTLTPLESVKVVILGQDPYHGPGQAQGLCFSVPRGVKIPPSLKNIYKELAQEFSEFETPLHGDLQKWAQQGVLLLNTVLTVEQGKAHSHAKIGWEHFTDAVISKLNSHCQGLVFLLWGSHAHKKGNIIDAQRHHVLTSAHPSPLSAHRGFLGCGHFAKVNQLLNQQGMEPINWQV